MVAQVVANVHFFDFAMFLFELTIHFVEKLVVVLLHFNFAQIAHFARCGEAGQSWILIKILD